MYSAIGKAVAGAIILLALLAPAALAIPVERDRPTVGTGTLAQLGDPANIASGASEGYLSKVRESRDTVGTGTLSQLGNSANIASGASQGYLSKAGRESPSEPAVSRSEGSTPEIWLWAGALVALISVAGAVAIGMLRHRSVATA